MLFWRPIPVTVSHAILAVAATLVLAWGGLWCWRNRDYLGPPVFPLSLMFYFMSFIAPLYFIDFVWGDETNIGVSSAQYIAIGRTALLGFQIDNIAQLGSVHALVVVLVGCVTYVAGFILSRPWLERRLPAMHFSMSARPHRPLLLLWGLVVIAVLMEMVPALATIPSMGQLLRPCALAGFAGFLIFWYRKMISAPHALLGCMVILALFVHQSVTQWAFTPFVFIGVLYVLISIYYKKKFPIIFSLIVIILFISLYSSKQIYRNIISDEKFPQGIENPTILGHIENVARIAGIQWIGSTSGKNEILGVHFGSIGANTLRPPTKRISLLPLLSHVVAHSPEPVPFWDGKSYSNLLTNFVPRAMWPGKPEERFGNSFGHRYNLLHPTDTVTAVNIPWLVELFANFGLWGVAIGMALFGILMACLDRVLNAARMGAVEMAVGLAIFFPLFLQESNFTVVVGQVLPLIVFFYLYFRIGSAVPLPNFSLIAPSGSTGAPDGMEMPRQSAGPAEQSSRVRDILIENRRSPFAARHRLALRIFLLFLLFGAALFIWRPDSMSLTQTGIVLTWVVLMGVASIVYYVGRDRVALPLFPVSLIFYALAFIAPFYLLPFLWPPTDRQVILLGYVAPELSYLGSTAALGAILLGLSGYVLGFLPARMLIFNRLPHMRLPDRYADNRLILLLWGLLLGHLVYAFVPFVTSIPSIGQFFFPAGYVAFGMFFLLWVRGRLSPLQAALVFLVALPAVLINGFLDWLITPIMLMGIFFVFVYYHNYQRAPLVVMIIAVIFLMTSYTGIQFYRVIEKNENWVQEQGDRNVGSKILNLGKLIVHIWIDPQGEDWRMFDQFNITVKGIDALRPIAKRVAMSPLLSHVTNQSPENVPYWNGESYRNLLVSVIPRLLWPDKPQERLGNEFGHRYHLLNPDDDVTSVNIPWLVEFYANFGTVGVFWGMFVIGIFLAFLDRFFNAPGMKGLEVIVGLAVIFPLIYQESNLTVMTGSVLPLALSLWLYFRVGLTIGTRPPSKAVTP